MTSCILCLVELTSLAYSLQESSPQKFSIIFQAGNFTDLSNTSMLLVFMNAMRLFGVATTKFMLKIFRLSKLLTTLCSRKLLPAFT